MSLWMSAQKSINVACRRVRWRVVLERTVLTRLSTVAAPMLKNMRARQYVDDVHASWRHTSVSVAVVGDVFALVILDVVHVAIRVITILV